MSVGRLPAWLQLPLGDDAWWGAPPGLSERDEFIFGLEQEPIYLPGVHVGVDALGDIGDLLDPLDLAVPAGPPLAVPNDPGSAEAAIDRLAWYVTFRSRPEWGIFIRQAGILQLASALEPENAGPSAEACRHAGTFLYLHEFAHFLVDVATRALEEVVGSGLYLPHRTEVARSETGWSVAEEAVCNAFAYRHLEIPGKKRALYRYLRTGPAGYADFYRYRADASFDAAVEEVLGEVLRGVGGDPGLGLRGLFADGRYAPVGPTDVPVYLVREPVAPQVLALITSLGPVEQSKGLARDLRQVPAAVRAELLEQVLPDLERDTRTHAFKRLKGDRDRFSARVSGSYRVILRQKSDGGWVAEGVDHRSKVYGR